MELDVTEQEEEIAMEMEAWGNCGKTAELTDAISTRQMVTKAHFTAVCHRFCAYSVCMFTASTGHWWNRKTSSFSFMTV